MVDDRAERDVTLEMRKEHRAREIASADDIHERNGCGEFLAFRCE